MFFTEFERLSEGSRPYAMFDAAIRWEMEGGALTAQGWIKTIANTLRRSSTFALSTGRVIGATYLPPRTYGVSLAYHY